MKKICKLFGVLLAFTMVIGLASCDGLFNPGNTGFGRAGNAGNSGSQQQGDETPINHTFYLSDNQFAHKYYTDTTHFSFTDKDGVYYADCIYQISFSPNTKGTGGNWIMYIRPDGSTSNKETQYKGTYEGDAENEGTLKLYVNDELLKTLTLENKEIQVKSITKTALTFTTDVAKAHKYYGAKDEK
ncbi:MAG: hypothetical protein J5726_04725 [Treponema sp.]|nr:hypothetical protein [Treponema sp.]